MAKGLSSIKQFSLVSRGMPGFFYGLVLAGLGIEVNRVSPKSMFNNGMPHLPRGPAKLNKAPI